MELDVDHTYPVGTRHVIRWKLRFVLILLSWVHLQTNIIARKLTAHLREGIVRDVMV